MDIVGAERRPLHLAVGILLFVMGLALALARLGPLQEIGDLRVGAPWVMGDFRHVVYYPTLAFWEGLNPYNITKYMERYPVDIPVNLYPPATFLLFAPFGLLPLELSTKAYFIVTLVLTLVVAWTVLRLAGWRPAAPAVLAVGGLLLLSRPGHWNLLSGQVTLIAVLATYGALIFARRAPQLAGVSLAIALLKPTFGVPLLPVLLARGAGRAVAWGLGLAVALNVPILLILLRREGGVAAFLTSVAQSVHASNSNPAAHSIHAVWRVDLIATISRLLDHPLGFFPGLLVSTMVLVLAVVTIRRLVHSSGSAQQRLMDALVCCAVLLSLYHQAYDLLLLALPAAGLARLLYEGRRNVIHIAQFVLFAILALNYFTTQAALTAMELTSGLRLMILTANGLALAGLFGLYLVEANGFQTAETRVTGSLE